jgi:hypothetical protein
MSFSVGAGCSFGEFGQEGDPARAHGREQCLRMAHQRLFLASHGIREEEEVAAI